MYRANSILSGLTVMVAVAILTVSSVGASSPELISYQGRLTDTAGVPVKDSTYMVHFGLYSDSVGGPMVWEENRLVTTSNGLFSIVLGESDPIQYRNFEMLTYPIRAYLGIQVGTDPEITPRTHLTSVPYSFYSVSSVRTRSIDGAAGGTISWKLEVTTNSGSALKKVGDRWRDNNIIAWGYIQSNGTIMDQFGVGSVVRTSTGTYEVDLYPAYALDTLTRLVPIVQPSSSDKVLSATVKVITNTRFSISLYELPSAIKVDGDLYFIVTGR